MHVWVAFLYQIYNHFSALLVCCNSGRLKAMKNFKCTCMCIPNFPHKQLSLPPSNANLTRLYKSKISVLSVYPGLVSRVLARIDLKRGWLEDQSIFVVCLTISTKRRGGSHPLTDFFSNHALVYHIFSNISLGIYFTIC